MTLKEAGCWFALGCAVVFILFVVIGVIHAPQELP